MQTEISELKGESDTKSAKITDLLSKIEKLNEKNENINYERERLTNELMEA